MRSIAPDRARDVAANVWDNEGLEFRKSLIDLFYIGLSVTDQSFIDERVRDRSKEVARTALQWSFLLRSGDIYTAAASLGERLLTAESGEISDVPQPVSKLMPGWCNSDTGIFLLSLLAPADVFSGNGNRLSEWVKKAEQRGKLAGFSRAVISAAVLHNDPAVLKAAISSGLRSPAAWAEAGRFLKPADWNLLAIHLLKSERDLTENLSYAVFMEKAPMLWTPEHARFFFEAYVQYRMDPMSGIHDATEKRVQVLLEKAALGIPPDLEGDLNKAWDLVANPFMPQSDPIHRFFDTLAFRNELRKLCQRK